MAAGPGGPEDGVAGVGLGRARAGAGLHLLRLRPCMSSIGSCAAAAEMLVLGCDRQQPHSPDTASGGTL
jgi:hypothetical protein